MISVSFESLVNTEGFQTVHMGEIRGRPFESLVNTEGFQTGEVKTQTCMKFESLVNTEGFQTHGTCLCYEL